MTRIESAIAYIKANKLQPAFAFGPLGPRGHVFLGGGFLTIGEKAAVLASFAPHPVVGDPTVEARARAHRAAGNTR